ncbi:MAG: Uma2 family endonuclease [Gemmataceae bacterium]|nr:Uma2 family endonuclease [Gemmataceae bacterium]
MSTSAMPPPAPRPRPIPADVPKGCELVNGKLRRLPMSALSSWVGDRVYDALRDHCRAARSGVTLGGETAFRCFPSKPAQVRKPDVSVIAGDPATFLPPPVGLHEAVPLLVVEVASPNERVSELIEKVNDFRAVRTPLIWIVYPESRQATVYRADGTTSFVTDPADLSGEGVLPGLVIPLAAVLPPAAPSEPGGSPTG